MAANLPLDHDPAREAINPMRGYSYQILISVLAWINLADDQVLYLEGAEDLDIVQGATATTVQVKDTAGSGNITLRTPGVIDALGHFWEHRRRNSNRRIEFQYLTTSGVGQEDGSPFGPHMPGIELWQRLKSDSDLSRRDAQLSALKTFLFAESRLPQQLREFLRAATDLQILEELVLPVEWITGASQSAAVLQTIKNRLVLHGDRKGVDASTAEKSAGALCLEAWTVATKDKDRALDRAEFLRLFDLHTRTSLPTSTVDAIFAQLTGSFTQSPLATVVNSARVIAQPPPSPPRYFRRQSLLDIIATATGRIVAVLYGATGTGKTTAAAAHCMNSTTAWGWVDLRGYDSSTIAHRLMATADLAEQSNEPLPIVLDDIDASQDPRPYLSALARLVATQRRRGAPLIVTTTHEPTPRITQTLGFDVRNVIRMPPFSRGEIATFLLERNCETGRVDVLASIIALTTHGHPQLVHARVAALETAGFPKPSATDLTQTPTDVLDAQAEARRLLSQLEPSARELIYRVSLTVNLIDRERLMAIAAAPPPIREPGNAVDQLIGPWIEIVSPDIFRVSPLVKLAGQEANGTAWAREMHGTIAKAFLARRTLIPGDVSEILMHALAAGNGVLIAQLSMGLKTADRNVWRAIAEMASWFTLMGVAQGTNLPTDHPGTLFLIRLMQYRIAAGGSDLEAARNVAARFDDEFPQASDEFSTRLTRFMFVSEMVVWREDIKYPIKDVVERVTQFVALADGLAEFLNQLNPVDPDANLMIGASGQRDYAVFASWTIILRTRTTDDLAELIDAINAIDAGYAQRILWGVARNESAARMMLDQIWLSEHRADVPDWPRYQTTLQRVYSTARRYDIQSLARAAAKVIVRATDEDLQDPDAALSLASNFAKDIGEFPALLDARARVQSRRGEDREAVALWRRALPEWRTDVDDSAPIFSHRDAAMAAARLNDWSEAARFLFEASRRTVSPDQDALCAGLLVDSGFARWKNADSVGAVECFAAGIAILVRLEEQATVEPVRSIQRRAGHTLMWVATVSNGKPPAQFSEPPAAFCSNLDPLPEPVPSLPPLDFIIEHLVNFEQCVNVGDLCWGQYNDRLRTSPYYAVRVTHAGVNVQRCLTSLHLDGLLSAAVDQVESLVLAKQSRDEGRAVTEPLPPGARAEISEEHMDLIRMLLLCGVYALTARGNLEAVPVEWWRKEARDRGIDAAIGVFLDAADALFISKTDNAWGVVRKPASGQWFSQDLGALSLSVADDTDAAQMIQCHGLLIAHLVTFASQRKIVADDLARIVTRAWRRLAGRPFLLRNPGYSVPAIEAAIESDVTGWIKVKTVLQAALSSVTIRLDDFTRVAIVNMPDE